MNALLENASGVFVGRPTETLLRLALAFALSSLSAISYYFIQKRERLTISNLPYTMILFSVIVCGMMMAVGESVARAFGLVGAISILRFRLNIQNPTDMAAILFTMTVGITAGISTPTLSILFTLVVLSVFFLLHFYDQSRYRLKRVLFLLVDRYTVAHAFIEKMKSTCAVEMTVVGTEPVGKKMAWKIRVIFPESQSIERWETWLKSDKRLLFIENKYHINLDISEWEPSE